MEQVAAARAHAMLTHSQGGLLDGDMGQSASQLANQLTGSIEEKQFGGASPFSSQKSSLMPKKTLAPVQTEKTANLIAQAIMHQQAKAAGVDESQVD